MYDTIKVSDFDKAGNDYCIDLEVDVSFDFTHDGVEHIQIDYVYDITDKSNPKELDLKSFNEEEISDLNARLEKEMWEKQDEYENDVYLAQADHAYDTWKDEVG